jgi:GDP-L-fucose synthase
MNLENKRVLLTGGYGFLGQWVEEKLMEVGVSSSFTPRHRDYDLRKRDNIERLFDVYNPHVVIHLAASVGGIQANYENPGKFFYDNIVMGAEMMDVAREREVEKFVQVGTSCSYPAIAPSPVKETDLWSGYPNEVTGAYGVAKLALITMAAAYRKQYGMNAITLIPVNLYGPKDSFDPKKSHVIPALITKTLEARRTYTPLTVWGTGDATREFLYVEDAAVAIVTATELYDSAEPVNIGTGIETSIKELVYLVAAALNFYGPIEFDPTKPEGQQRRVFDVSRAKREFGFEANTTLADGIERTVKWYLEHHA